MTENEMAGWHHQLNGHEFEQALRVGDGQGSLVCYSPWGCKESDMTERLNNNNNNQLWLIFCRKSTSLSVVNSRFCYLDSISVMVLCITSLAFL